MIKAKSVEKSVSWGKEDTRGNLRFNAVVRFTKADNKFIASSVGGLDYPLSYDLVGMYKDDAECQDLESGEFDAEKAFVKFTREAREEEILEGLNLYEIDLPFAVKVQGNADARPFSIHRQAYYGSETEAKEYVIAALNRDISRGRLVRVEEDGPDGKHVPKEIKQAVLKKIEVNEYLDSMPPHSIRMYFAETSESDELYVFGTTIEAQFCDKGEFDRRYGLSKELFQQKVDYANSFVGKTYDVNLFEFSVMELTNNRYVAFDSMNEYHFDCDSEEIKDYHIASYMTKEDIMLRMKYAITMQGLEGMIEGILPDRTTEEITTTLFFPKPVPEKKHFDIPYGKYPNLNESFIVNEVSIDEIRNGHHLANQIKEYNISESDFNSYMDQIAGYCLKVRASKATNESIRKKIFFWEPKEVVGELKMNPNVISMFIDSIILSRLYSNDCSEATKAYHAECERKLRETFMHEDVDKKEFKDKFAAFRKALSEKYKGQEVLKQINEYKQ